MSQKLQKTIKLPVSEEITEEKLYKLDRLTARLTYGVDLFLRRIVGEDITTKARANRYNKEIQELTGLSSGFVQCCRDKALWMYKSYKSNYREWEKKVAKLEDKIKGCKSKKNVKILKRKLYRLRKREPSPPKVTNKIPILFDQRIGSVQVSDNAKEFNLWCRISTLEKGKRMDIPLYSYPYAEKHMGEGWIIKSFQIVWRGKARRYEVHVVVEKELKVNSVKSVAGMDLGLKRLVTAFEANGEGDRVTFTTKEEYKEFFIQMRRLNNRISKLQRLGKIKSLKKLKRKRRNFARDFRRKLAVDIAKGFENSIVFIGHPQHIRTEHYRGSGGRRKRKRVNHWAFMEFAEALMTELMENGNQVYITNEWGSTKTCSNCGSKNTQVNDREFLCLDCGQSDDRDGNASKNILKSGLTQIQIQTKVSSGTGAEVALPEVGMIG